MAMDETAGTAPLDKSALLDAIFRSAMESMVTVDILQRIVLFNPAAEAMFGYKAEEVVGKPLDLLLPRRYRGSHRGHLRKFGQEMGATRRKNTFGEVLCLRRNGEEFPAESVISKVATGGQWFFTVFLRDLTPERNAGMARTEADTDRQRLLVHHLLQTERMPLACIVADTEFRITEWNPAAERIFGWSREEVLGKQPYEAMVPADDRNHVDELRRRIKAGDHGAHGLSENLTKDGRRIRCQWFSTPIFDGAGKFAGFLSMVRDITDETRIQDEIRTLYRDLESRLAERTRELEHARREIKSFALALSRDLRPPLRAVSGFAHALAESDPPVSDENRRSIDRIITAADRMNGLLDGLLHLVRISRIKLNLCEVDLGALAQDAIEELRQSYRRGTVSVGRLPVVRGDKTLLRLVFDNLLGNALKYSAKRSEPRVEIGCERDKGIYVLSVTDNGVGFDGRHASKLFGAFQRMHRDDEFPGTGIGLAIVKRIIERHGGAISAQAEFGKGATFRVALPVPGAAEYPAPPAIARTSAPNPAAPGG